jgi:type II secretory pathway component GspD/PulD (secretin)
MKHMLLSLTLVGIVACSLAGFAQTTSPASDTAAASATATKDAAQPAAPPDPAPAAGAPAPAAAQDAAQPAAAASSPPAAETPAPAAAQVAANDAAQPAAAASNPPAAEAKASSTAQPGALIPLIVMDDVPLTDAIRNLARQAGINYMLDPKIGFGQIGADGKTTPQPSVSLRWENITAEQALAALLNNYTLQLVEDPKSKIARVTTKDPAAPPPLSTKIIQLKYAAPTNVVANVQSILLDKRSRVMPDVRTSQLVVVATEAEMVDVDQLIERLDTQTKQVLIEARILETTVNPTTKKGVDWTGTLDHQNVSVGNNLQLAPTTANNTLAQPPFPKMLFDTAKGFNPATAFLDADGVNATLSFLNTYAEVKEIATPRTVTLDNEKAIVEVGELYPIVNVSAGTSQTSGGSQITYSNLTIRLEVTPRISANDYVNLTVTPSISANSVDSFLTRNMSTHVMIPSGNTLVMGGLIQDQINTGNIKVPILGDIPVLGYLFRSDSKARNKTDLVIFITPTIVADQDYQPNKTDYLKTPAPKSDYLEGETSAWDSGKPKDWSKQAARPDLSEQTPPAN